MKINAFSADGFANLESFNPNLFDEKPPENLLSRPLNPAGDVAGDEHLDKLLRPGKLSEFIGHEHIVRQLTVALNGSSKRGKQMDHVLFVAAPGTGKTTLANILINEIGLPSITTTGSLVVENNIINEFERFKYKAGVLFIDELLNMRPRVSTVLGKMIEEGRITKEFETIVLKPVCVIGATTDIGSLQPALVDRFIHIIHVPIYDNDTIAKICKGSAQKLDIDVQQQALMMFADRARGTPRIVNRLLKIARNYNKKIDNKEAAAIFTELGIDEFGLDWWDRRYVKTMALNFNGGPASLNTIAGNLLETEKTIERVLEPHLLRCGLIMKTGKGRMLTNSGKQYVKNMLGI